MITHVAVAVAFNNDAGSMNFFAFRGKKIDRHFGPLRDWFVGAKFDTVRANFHGLRRKCQAGLRAMHMQGLEDARSVEFASAHIG